MKMIKPRNMLLVIPWSYGLFVLMHMYQYLGVLIASWSSGRSFEAIISGGFESAQTDMIISVTALIVGVPLIFLIVKFLWRRSIEWICPGFDLKPLLTGIVFGFLLPFVILFTLVLLDIAEVSWQTDKS